MMLTDLSKEKKKVVGIKQTLKAIKNGEVRKVFMANDIDQSLKDKIFEATTNHDIPVEIVDSKFKLGRICGIDVTAAVAALLI